MAVDACHVIYEIRITRQCFKWNPELGQTKHRVGGTFFGQLLLYVYMLFLACACCTPPLIISCNAFLISKCTLSSKKSNLFYIKSLSVRSNILLLPLHHSILLPTVGSIYSFSAWYDIICQMMNAFSSLFVFPTFFSPHLFSLWGHYRARRQVFPTQLFSHASPLQLHSHSQP